MQHTAIISDIHGNMPALEAVLADIHTRGIDTIYCLGDLVGKGPSSAEVFDLCHQVCSVIIRGNWDDGLAKSNINDEHGQWQQTQLGQQRLDRLKNLPNTYNFIIGGKRVRLLHASQISEHHRIHQHDSYETHLTMFENTPFTGCEPPIPDVVIYGDIHITYMKSLYREHRTLINVGSVGNPLDIPLASYVILRGDDNNALSVEYVRLPYDIERAIQDAEDYKMPLREPYTVELKTAVYRGRQTT